MIAEILPTYETRLRPNNILCYKHIARTPSFELNHQNSPARGSASEKEKVRFMHQLCQAFNKLDEEGWE